MSNGSTRARRLVVTASAKVNLVLEVLGRRADGYHEIATVMQPVDLADRLVLESAPTIELIVEGDARRADGEIPADRENLAVRAAEALAKATGVERGVRIRLDKRIPVAAGLGGGSADAAAVLVGLNRLWGVRWPLARLADVAVSLGMDVPFFLRGGAALATGRGEHLSRIPSGSLGLVLVKPAVGVGTAEAYASLTPAMYSDGSRARAMAVALATRRAQRVAAALHNAFEAAIIPRHPEIGRVKAAVLAAGALGAAMSGSGSTVFGVARSWEHARQLRARLNKVSWACWAVRTTTGPAIRVRTH